MPGRKPRRAPTLLCCDQRMALFQFRFYALFIIYRRHVLFGDSEGDSDSEATFAVYLGLFIESPVTTNSTNPLKTLKVTQKTGQCLTDALPDSGQKRVKSSSVITIDLEVPGWGMMI